jgi:hypothetical protein
MRFAFTAIDYPDRDSRYDPTRGFYSGFSLVLEDGVGRRQRVPLLRNTPLRRHAPETYFAALGLQRGAFIGRRDFRSGHEYVPLTREALEAGPLLIDETVTPLLARIDAQGRWHYLTAPLAVFAHEDWKPDFLAAGLTARGFFVFGLKSRVGEARQSVTLAVCGVLLGTHGPSSLYELAQLSFDCESALVTVQSVHPGLEGSTMMKSFAELVREHNRIAREGGPETPLLSLAGMDGLRTRFARDVLCAEIEVG